MVKFSIIILICNNAILTTNTSRLVAKFSGHINILYVHTYIRMSSKCLLIMKQNSWCIVNKDKCIASIFNINIFLLDVSKHNRLCKRPKQKSNNLTHALCKGKKKYFSQKPRMQFLSLGLRVFIFLFAKGI